MRAARRTCASVQDLHAIGGTSVEQEPHEHSILLNEWDCSPQAKGSRIRSVQACTLAPLPALGQDRGACDLFAMHDRVREELAA